MLQIGGPGGAITRRGLVRGGGFAPFRPGKGTVVPPGPDTGPTRNWGNIFIPPTLSNWREARIGTSLPLTTNSNKPYHQVTSAPLDGQNKPLYIFDQYDPGDNLRLIGDGSVFDMPLHLPYTVNALHVIGVRMDLNPNLAYMTSGITSNGSGPDYRVYRNKAPFHVTWTYLYIIEGCMVHAHGVAFDIIQLPPTSNGDLVDSNTRELYILNSAFFDMGGLPTGFHGDFVHSADNMMKKMRIENVFCRTSYNCVTLYPIAGVPPCRDAKLRNCSFPTGPVGVDGRNPSNNFAFVGMPTPPQFENVYHPWGAYTDPGGVGHQAPGLQGNTILPQSEIAPDEFLGENYLGSSPAPTGGVDLGLYDFTPTAAYARAANTAYITDMAGAGYKYVMNYGFPNASDADGGTLADILWYLDLAAANGMKVITCFWNNTSTSWAWNTDMVAARPALAAELGATDTADLITKIVQAIKDHPGNSGYYYLVDEREANADVGGVTSGTIILRNHNAVKAGDSTAKTIGLWWFGQNYAAYSFLDVIGLDHYPYDPIDGEIAAQTGSSRYHNPSHPYGELNETQVQPFCASVSQWCRDNGKEFYFAFQAFAACQYRSGEACYFPSLETMEKFKSDAIAGSVAVTPFLLAYSYGDATGTRFGVLNQPPSGFWADRVARLPNGSAPPVERVVTGGDGTIGALSPYHPSSEAVLPLKRANGWDQMHPAEALITVTNTVAHPNPNRTNVYEVEWNTSVPLLNGNKRSELFLPISSSGVTWSEGNTPEFRKQPVYFAWAMRLIEYNLSSWCVCFQQHSGNAEGTGNKIQLGANRNLIWRRCGATSCTNYNFRGGAALPLNKWIMGVIKILHSDNNVANGAATAWAMIEGETAFEQFGNYTSQVNMIGPELGRHKLGFYVDDGETGSIKGQFINPVRGTGFASVVEEAFGLTVG